MGGQRRDMSDAIPDGVPQTVAQLAVAYDIAQKALLRGNDTLNRVDVTSDQYIAKMTNAVIKIYHALAQGEQLPEQK